MALLLPAIHKTRTDNGIHHSEQHRVIAETALAMNAQVADFTVLTVYRAAGDTDGDYALLQA